MKRGSTHNRKEEEEEEEDDSSGDSDTATTKPTSRALKCLASFNQSAKTTAGCDSSGRDRGGTNSTSGNRRSGLNKNAASGGGGGVCVGQCG